MFADLVLVSHHLCPYVQRAAIALAEKGVPFERVTIDLADKPSWFTAISPLGKVPLLKIGERTIFESNVILEFLEETQPNPLHPSDPLDRADHRAWIEFGSATLNVIGGFYSAGEISIFEKHRLDLATKFSRVEKRLTDGPWFGGTTFSLVDAVYAPVFRYFDTFDRIGDFGILAGKPKLAAWRQALAMRPSIRNAVAADYPERLENFLRRRQSHLSSLMTEPARTEAAA